VSDCVASSRKKLKEFDAVSHRIKVAIRELKESRAKAPPLAGELTSRPHNGDQGASHLSDLR